MPSKRVGRWVAKNKNGFWIDGPELKIDDCESSKD